MLNFGHLLELDELAREGGKRYPKKRRLYGTIIDEKGKHIIGIIGLRGVGKTPFIYHWTPLRKRIYLMLPKHFLKDMGSVYFCWMRSIFRRNMKKS